MLQIIIPAIIGAVIAAIIVGYFAHSAGRSYERKQYDSKVGSAEEKAREIIDEALKTAETKKREALLEAKEESLKTKNELEKETKERRAELQRYEKRVLSKEENVEKKADALEKKEADLVRRENILGERTAEVDTQYEQGIQELERISGLTSEQAKEYLLKSVEEDVKHDTAKLIKELENKAKEDVLFLYIYINLLICTICDLIVSQSRHRRRIWQHRSQNISDDSLESLFHQAHSATLSLRNFWKHRHQ